MNTNLAEHTNTQIRRTYAKQTKLIPEILSLPGMSGQLGRILLNNICELENCSYMEIGCYKGSTLISAAYNNIGSFLGIDNFSQFDGTRGVLEDNIKNFAPHISFIEQDCWLPLPDIAHINVYFFDGAHDYESQRKAVTNFTNNLANEFILIIDDFIDQDVQRGTYDGIENAKLHILSKHLLGLDRRDDGYGFWNGMGVFVLGK